MYKKYLELDIITFRIMKLLVDDEPMDSDEVSMVCGLIKLHLDFHNGNITGTEFDEEQKSFIESSKGTILEGIFDHMYGDDDK